MEIVVLGGAGQEGRTAVERLAADDRVDRVVVADLDLDKAEALAAASGPKVSARHVDVRDAAALADVLTGPDVVMNLVGPYFLFQERVLRAAIAAAIDYVDISDDWEPTRTCLALSEQAAAAGVTAIVGLGVSPGAMNVLARHGAERLDRVDEVHLRWAVSVTDVDDIGASAASHHALHMMEAPFPTFRDGQTILVEPFSDPETFDFPKLGPQRVFNVGHPEPVTLPDHLTGVRAVSQKGSVPGFNEVWELFHELGLTRREPLLVDGRDVSPQGIAMALVEAAGADAIGDLPPPISEFHTFVHGVRDGREVVLEYSFASPDRMSPLTGTPAYLGAVRLGRGLVAGPGVFPPEACLEPDAFIADLVAEGFVIDQTETVRRTL